MKGFLPLFLQSNQFPVDLTDQQIVVLLEGGEHSFIQFFPALFQFLELVFLLKVFLVLLPGRHETGMVVLPEGPNFIFKAFQVILFTGNQLEHFLQFIPRQAGRQKPFLKHGDFLPESGFLGPQVCFFGGNSFLGSNQGLGLQEGRMSPFLNRLKFLEQQVDLTLTGIHFVTQVQAFLHLAAQTDQSLPLLVQGSPDNGVALTLLLDGRTPFFREGYCSIHKHLSCFVFIYLVYLHRIDSPVFSKAQTKIQKKAFVIIFLPLETA